MSEKTVANGVIRIVMDGTEDVLGTNGLNALLNFAKMSSLIEHKPDYGYDKNYTDDEYARIITGFYDLLGISGAKSVFRMVGKAIAKRTASLGLFDSVKDFPPEERLLKAIEIYATASGRGKAFAEDGVIVYDNPACSTCHGIQSDVPTCTTVSGFLDDMVKWAGIGQKHSVETKCKAMGDDTCRYEILPVRK